MQFKKIEETQYKNYRVEDKTEKISLIDINYFDLLLKDTKKIEGYIQSLESAIEQQNISEFSNSLIKAIKNTEELVHKFKILPINFGMDKTITKNSSYLCDTDLLFIERVEEDIYKIVFRDLLPRRMKNGNMTDNLDYLRYHYYTAFEKFFAPKRDFKKYTERVVIIYQNYFTEINGIMDDDNFDIKLITDFISQYMLIDDNPVRCMKIFDYGMDNHKHSEIMIMPEAKYLESIRASDKGRK